MSALSTPSDRHLCNQHSDESDHGVLLVAHGSRDSRAATVAHDVAAGLSTGGGLSPGGQLAAAAAFLELAEPTTEQALDGLVRRGVRQVTVVPFLLGRAYHAKTDLPDVLRSVTERELRLRVADVLGPDPLLASLLIRRIAETRTGFDAVVLAAAGSSDPEGNAGVRQLAEVLADELGVPVWDAYASAARPDPGTAVAEARVDGRVLVATYLLAPGYFADTVAASTRNAGAVAVTEPLGAAPEVVRLVAERVRTAQP